MLVLGAIEPYVGKYFSQNWVRTNILKQTDEEMQEIDKEIEEERAKLEALTPSSEEDAIMPSPPLSSDAGAPAPMPAAPAPPQQQQQQQEPPPPLDSAFGMRK
jgi:hypothetical protein